MVMVLFNAVRRWWQMGAGSQGGLSLARAAVPGLPERPVILSRRVAPRGRPVARRLPAKPLTPFGAQARARTALPIVARVPVRRFWITVDPQDRRHTALGGSFAEVCAALEQLAALEEQRF